MIKKYKYIVLCVLIILLFIITVIYYKSNSIQVKGIDDKYSIKKVTSNVHLIVDTDSIRCILRITNNSKKIVYYPTLRYMVADLFPLAVYCQPRFDNGHVVNIFPCNIDGASSSLDIIMGNNYIPNYYVINPNSSLDVKLALPFEYYRSKYLSYFNSGHKLFQYKFEFITMLTFREELATENSSPLLQQNLEYNSFWFDKEYEDNLYEMILFDTTTVDTKNNYYKKFDSNKFIIKCDTIIDLGAEFR